MTLRRELEQSLRRLGEIGEIMRSMKNLAVMETRKLARLLDAQGESVRLIEAAAADFLCFFPQLAPRNPAGAEGVLVIGTERGFCGDFNDALLEGLAQEGDAPAIAVGSKLCARLEGHHALAGALEGPSVAEDVPRTINRLVPELGRMQQTHACQGLAVLHHRSGEAGINRKSLLPPFTQSQAPKLSHPPLLNLPPETFFAGLVRHYLFAVLHELLYSSLMAENQRRIQHLEGAIQRLDEKTKALSQRARTLRQEEITEEIEIILLSVEGSLASKPRGWD